MIKNIPNRITQSLAALGLLALTKGAWAASLAITNATVHTNTEAGVLANATVLVEDGVITAINPGQLNADATVDAKGATLTPGLIAPMNRLGLVEVSAVPGTRDMSDEKADITFTPGLAFNFDSTAIPYSRRGGFTSAIIAPTHSKSIFYGQTAVVNLSGEPGSVEEMENALVVALGDKRKGSRAHSLQALANKLEDAAKKQEKEAKKDKKDQDKKDNGEPSREDKLINAVLAGEKPVVAFADRASDLLQLLELKRRFNLKLVISGGADAVKVADQLAQAGVPVLLDGVSNLPTNFDSLGNHLENAGKLSKAGVTVLLGESDTHMMYQARFNAGNAVSHGMSKEDALKAMTVNIAKAFNLDGGTIEVGKPADLVLWNGDLFELSGYVEKMWISGKEYSTESRQDLLRDRYMKQSDMPEAYRK